MIFLFKHVIFRFRVFIYHDLELWLVRCLEKSLKIDSHKWWVFHGDGCQANTYTQSRQLPPGQKLPYIGSWQIHRTETTNE